MRKPYIMDVLVRKRLVFLVAAVLVAIACVFMIPHTRINSDMTRYLPDDSRMRQGINQMTEEFGEDGVGSGVVRVMFWSLPDSLRNTTKETLSDIDGVSNILYQDGSQDYNHGDKVLYELLCSSQRSQQDIADEISEQYGSRVVIETSEQGTMAPIGVILIAFALLLIVLFIMCESWLEPPIFLAAIGVALAVNLGTNALFSSVSATTNSIAGILQLVLSIDYSIILMNRYRQEKALGSDKITAMTNALKKASRSIVSSAFTTIVGLLALLFMKFKIGADMGVVLAKGVLCSLLSIFTVLPSLILALDNAIEKSTKRVLRFSTDRLAGFNMKSRIPMALLFVAIFVGSYFLHKKTEISFSLEQKSEISKYFPPKNIIVLLYENSDSSRVIGLADSLAVNPNVKSFVSYPSLMQKQHTASSVKKLIEEFSAMLDNNNYGIADYDINTAVDAIFYMGSKKPNDEKMTLHDFALLAANLSSDTTLLARFGNQFSANEDALQSLDALIVLTDTSLINRKMTAEEISEIVAVDKELISLICPENQKMSIREIINTSKELLNESKRAKQVTIKTPEPQPVVDLEEAFLEIEIDTLEIPNVVVHAENTNVSDDEDKIYKDSTIFMKQYSASEIAQLIGMDGRSASIVYTLYGKKVRHKTKTMSVFDFIHFVNNDLANRKLFASQIGDENRKLLKQKEDLMLAALHPVETEKPEEKPIVVVEEPLAETSIEAFEEIIEEQEPIVVKPQNDEENKEYAEKLNKAEMIMAIAAKGDSLNAVEMESLLNTLGANMELRDIELAYLYNGILHFDDDNVILSAEEIIGTLHDSIIDNPRFASIVNDEMKCGMDSINAMIVHNFGRLNGRNFSQAIIMTDLPKESDETSEFVEMLASQCDTWLAGSHYLVGESVMMDEMRNRFGNEMLLVTFITILSIFLIVAITFCSLAVPAILVMTVMSAVYISVIVSGLNGHLLYLAYLIMQSILMGATIDYGILFTNNYREARASNCKIESIRRAYMSSTHTIITSGMIMTLAPLAMSFLLDDTAIVMILQCIAAGALAAVLLIVFVLPGLLAALDKFVVKNKHHDIK